MEAWSRQVEAGTREQEAQRRHEGENSWQRRGQSPKALLRPKLQPTSVPLGGSEAAGHHNGGPLLEALWRATGTMFIEIAAESASWQRE